MKIKLSVAAALSLSASLYGVTIDGLPPVLNNGITIITETTLDPRVFSTDLGGDKTSKEVAQDGLGLFIYKVSIDKNKNIYDKNREIYNTLVNMYLSSGTNLDFVTWLQNSTFDSKLTNDIIALSNSGLFNPVEIPILTPEQFTCYTGYQGDPYNGNISCSNGVVDENGNFTGRLDDGWKGLNSVVGSIYLINNQLTDIFNLLNLTYVSGTLDLESNSLNNINGLNNLQYVENLDLRINNNIQYISELSNLTYIQNISLPNNIVSLNGLENISEITNVYLSLYGGDYLTDISAIRNITNVIGNIDISDNSYDNGLLTVKLPQNAWLCRTENSNVWHGVVNSDYLYQFEGCENLSGFCADGPSSDVVNFTSGIYSGNVICNSQLPKLGDPYYQDNGGLRSSWSDLTKVIGNLNLSYNTLTNIDSLSNLTEVTGTLDLTQNSLTNLNGLSNLTTVGQIRLTGSNSITDLSPLSNISSIDLIYLPNNLSNLNGLNLTNVNSTLYEDSNILSDITSLSKITYIAPNGLRIIDSSYNSGLLTGKLPLTAWLCKYENRETWYGLTSSSFLYQYEGCENIGGICPDGPSSDTVNFTNGVYSGDVLCNNTQPKLGDSYYQDNGGLRSSWSDLTKVIGNLNLSYNVLTNIDSLSNLTEVTGILDLSGNYNLNSISSLSNLIAVDKIILSGTNVADLSPLSNLTDLTYLNTSSVVTTLNGLQNIRHMSALSVNSSNLTDISALQNITAIDYSIFISDDSYDSSILTTKIPSTAWLCKYENSAKWFKDTSLTLLQQTEGCENIGGFCQDGPSYDSVNFSSGVYNGNVICNNIVPKLGNPYYQDNGGLRSSWSDLIKVIGNLDLSYNVLTNIDSLSNLTEVTGTLDLSGNSLTNINGLSNLTEVTGTLDLSYNSNLNSISSLSNLIAVNKIYFNNTNVADLSPLSNLTDLTNLYTSSVVTTLNGLQNIRHMSYLTIYSDILTDISALQNITAIDNYIIISDNSFDNGILTTKIPSTAWLCKYENSAKWFKDTSLTLLQQTEGCENIGGFCQEGPSYDSVNFSGGVYSGDVICNNIVPKLGDPYYQDNGGLRSSWSDLIKVIGNLDLSNNYLTNVDNLSNLTEVTGRLYLSYNTNLSNINGLSNLNTVEYLYLDNTGLNDISPLSNLLNVYYLMLPYDLYTLNGLNNLTTVGYIRNSATYGNNLSDVSALQNLTDVSGYIMLSDNSFDNGVLTNKVPSTAWLCQSSNSGKWYGNLYEGYLKQTEGCDCIDSDNNGVCD